MSGKTAAIIGATGMIGSYLLEELVNDLSFETIRVIVRRPFTKTSPKEEIKLVDFTDYESVKLAIDGSDVLFCTIGTTQKNVKGDKELYRKIDFDIPVKAARACKETGCKKMLLVTAVGSNSKSSTFYVRLKGEVEDAVSQSGVEAVHIFQPSMLLGERKENRPLERIFQSVFKATSFLLAGSWRKFRPVHGKEIAKAMIRAAKISNAGLFRYEYDSIKKLAD